MSSTGHRSLDLACDRALGGIDADEERELASLQLASLLAPTDDIAFELERAAAAVALSEIAIDEPLPEHLAQAILASAHGAAPRTRAGTALMTPGGGAMPMPFTRNEAPTRLMPPRLPPMTAADERPRAASSNVVALPARRSSSAVWGWLAAAACLALAIGSFVLARRPVDGGQPVAAAESAAQRRDRLVAEAKDLVRVPWSATEDPSGKSEGGEVVWSSARQEGYMTFRGLAANDPTKEQYQLWIFDRERDERYPVDGGVFDVTAGGEVVVPITARVSVAKPKLFAVTVEKPGGVVVSTRERIAVAAPVEG